MIVIIVSGIFSPSLAIMAGGETALPADAPSLRIDPLRETSSLNFAGAVEIIAGTASYIGSAAVLSPHWVLTAGHNVDLNDDGFPDPGLIVNLHLPGFGSWTAESAITHPLFEGFGNSLQHHDLSLLRFDDPLPADLLYPALGLSIATGEQFLMAGFGRSGYGDYGYTANASLSDRRWGYNIIDDLKVELNGIGQIFTYDFDSPSTTGHPDGSLGNTLETLIGPGDSGGPALISWGGGHALVGINTFTYGYGGRFGDVGGGVTLEPYWDWIHTTTGLPLVPELETHLLVMLGICVLLALKTRHD